MTDKIDELMRLADEYAYASTKDQERYSHDALRAALEAALKQGGEPIGYRYKYKNCFGNVVWSFELPRSIDTKVLETVPVYTAAPPAQTPVPPRLTVSEICEADPMPHAMFDDERVEFARAIESAVRKQAGWE
jgi:hypothetical protein